MSSQPVYSLRVPEVFQAFETCSTGLSIEQAQERRSLYGENLLTEEKTPPLLPRFLSHTTHPMALLLWVSGALAIGVGQPVLGIVIWLLVIVNAGFSFWREYRAEQAIIALRKMLPSTARVLRSAQECKVDAADLVPGDILVLAEGDHIPADARVVEEYGLRVSNATLTGEALPSHKTADASLREDISEVERPNLIFAGTSVVSGTGRAVVYATGMLTQFGRIARLTQAVKEEPSPIQKELMRVTRLISIVAISTGAIIFAIGVFEVKMPLFEAFLLALGILVAAIPEGLSAITTLSLAMAGQRLAQRGVLVKKLAILETLGTVSIICTDKSGTLTQNQMTVRDLWVGGAHLAVSGAGYKPEGAIAATEHNKVNHIDLTALLQAAMLCNNSRLQPPTSERPLWSGLGDQTEVALKVVAQKGDIVEDLLNEQLPRFHELPFDARRKRMTTIHHAEQGEVAFIKGAPREVLDLCTQVLINGEERPLDATTRKTILAENDRYARGALRVLALARRELPPRSGTYLTEQVEHDLTFLGLAAMMDPPRPEVADALKICRQAGIRLVMITGDYGLTAESFARRVGMLYTPNPTIMTGAELDELNDAQLRTKLQDEIIFARMAPEHKLRLVAAYQATGEMVAVTGDGVNDVPALRKADVGIAMGQIGTDVAKEAADLILTNDNFATIVNAIQEGRAIFDNLRKFVTYTFASNIPEILPFLLTAMFNLPLALTVRQILAIDLGTDLFPALALGIEKPESDVMDRPPRKKNQPFLDSNLLTRAFLWLGMIEAVICYLAFLFITGNLGDWPLLRSAITYLRLDQLTDFQRYALGITVYHAGVVMSQVGNAFACRTQKSSVRRMGFFSNIPLLQGILVEIAIILLLIYVPFLAGIFNHVPLPPMYWIGLALFAPLVYILEWLRKYALRLRDRFFSISVER